MHQPPLGRLVVGATAVCTSALVFLTTACGDSPTRPSLVVSGPTLSLVVPSMGPTEGSVEIRIVGNGFRPGATVSLDGPVTNVVVATSALITATAQPHPAGAVDVVVTNPDGRSARLTGGFIYAPLSIASVSPKDGLAGGPLTITGTGFVAGAAVTIGGSAAIITAVTPTSITAIVPSDVVGTVDVVVTNPGGQSVSLDGALTILVLNVAASPDVVAPGGQLTVSWAIPGRVPLFDWIGLFRVGDQNTNYLWWDYVPATSGSFMLTAPVQPGDYEFRYLIDDGYVDIARSNRVIVRAGG